MNGDPGQRRRKLVAHDRYAPEALAQLRAWLGEEPELVLAAAKGRHAWGSIRFGDRLMYELSDDELWAAALEELADAVNYVSVIERRAEASRLAEDRS